MVSGLSPDDPRSVGPYVLTGVLGGGGMGRVFLGMSAGGRPVAVKVIRPELAGDAEFRARFAREVAAARKVSGLFTALVVGADTDGPVPWLATAYVPGPSLAQFAAENGPLLPAAVLALAAGLAEGLAAIHAEGVVHRDLKPSNVLLAPDGPRVIDFGISRAAEATTLTHTGLIVGSPGFMSPEQATGSEVGPSSDVFALGAVLVFAATGQGPFGAGSTPALVYRVVHQAPSLEEVPDTIRPLVERCLAKDPALRPTTSDLLLETRAAQPGPGWLPEQIFSPFGHPDTVTVGDQRPKLPVTVPPSADRGLTTRPNGAEGKRRMASRRSLATAGIIAGLLAVFAGAAFALSRPTSGHPSSVAAPAVGSRKVQSSPSVGSTPDTAAKRTDTTRPAAPARTPITSSTSPATRSQPPGAQPAQPSSTPPSQPASPQPTQTASPQPVQPPTTSASPTPTSTVLGPVDLNAWCQYLGYANAELVASNAYGWRCVTSAGATASIDIVAACRHEYSDPTAEAYYSNYDDPDSWYCAL